MSINRIVIALLLSLLVLSSGSAQFASQVVNSIVATTCSNQFVRTITATGAATCAAVATADITANNVTNAKLATMSASTFKGQIVGGSGDPVDMTAAQAAAVIGTVGGALKTKLIQITRDLTAATGSVAYTGCGFQPSALLAVGSVAASLTQYITVFGMVDSSVAEANTALATSTISTGAGNLLVFGDITGNNFNNAAVASFDADGFTLSWTKTNTPTGTATIQVLCLR